jgi:hypothetical protein
MPEANLRDDNVNEDVANVTLSDATSSFNNDQASVSAEKLKIAEDEKNVEDINGNLPVTADIVPAPAVIVAPPADIVAAPANIVAVPAGNVTAPGLGASLAPNTSSDTFTSAELFAARETKRILSELADTIFLQLLTSIKIYTSDFNCACRVTAYGG